MIDSTLARELYQQLETLPEPKQRLVLEYARELAASHPRGISGQQFLAMTGTIASDDLGLMKRALEDCERVDLDEW